MTAAVDTRRRVQWVMMGMLMTLLAAFGLSAWAQPAPPTAPGVDGGPPSMGRPMHDGMRHGMHRGRHGHGGPGMMFRGSPEQIGRKIDFMLDGLHATDAQRSQIKQIAVQAAADLKAQAVAGKGLRQRDMQIFTAPTIDAAAAEQTREQMLQQHDRMSKRAMQAMLDMARVLTPEQRGIIGERIRDRQARMHDRMERMKERMQRQPPQR
ncbi:MAG TPA: Spy/CpxP family protein refolding chaperone [Caldimonas sp.]|nr:Spy/CpxP family protein refolding chaperone [Caldimonas sp.]